MTDDTGASRLDGMTSLALPRTATSATTNPASTAPTAPSTATDPHPAPRRDHLIDLLRIASAGVVVTMHWLSTRVWVDGDGMHSTLALEGRTIFVLGWLLQVMPVLFIAGGFANTKVVDSCRAKGQSATDYLGIRARRLTTPLVLLAAVIVPVTVVGNLMDPSIGAMLGDQAARPLWFLAVYLVITAAAPLMVRAHDRSGLAVPAALLLLALGLDLVRYEVGTLGGVNVGMLAMYTNLVVVWLFVHQLGIIHARGVFARVPAWGLVAVAGAVAALITVMVDLGPWPAAMVGTAEDRDTNLLPPTVIIGLLGLVQMMVIALVSRATARWNPSTSTVQRIGVLNALMMVVYLWHVPVIATAIGIALLAPDTLLPSDEATWWAMRPGWFLACGLLLLGITRLAVRWELFCARFAVSRQPVRVVLGALAATAGTFLVWQYGLLTTDPLAVTGLALVLLGAAVLTTRERKAPVRLA